MNNRSFDVLVVGGGLAGLTFALQLKRASPGTSIIVLDRDAHPVPEAAHKVGESTVEIAAHYFRDVLGLGDHLRQHQLRKLGLRVFFPFGDNGSIEKRFEFGSNSFFPASTNQIDRGRFENHLIIVCRAAGIEVVDDVRVREIALDDGGGNHRVAFSSESSQGGAPQQVSGRWLIDASGRAALLKKKLGLEKQSDHAANAAWFRLGTQINIDAWGSSPRWTENNQGEKSRWFSTNHLIGAGYWVWIIPLASGATSIGIVADPRFHPLAEFNTFERALSWLDRHEPQCAKEVRRHEHLLQDFIARKHYSHKATQVFSEQRWGLTGDAGIFIDPLYSPGSDFIALANTFLCDLIQADISGKPIAGRAQIYNDLFISFTENTFLVFENQYEIFGNAPVMSAKIFWDFATYWSFFGFLFFNGRITDVRLLGSVEESLEHLSSLNRQMQDFFRDWHRADCREWGRGFLDVAATSYLYELNRQLTNSQPDGEILPALERNLAALRNFAAEIVEFACASVPSLPRPQALQQISSGTRYLENFREVFAALSDSAGLRVNRASSTSGRPNDVDGQHEQYQQP